jgi:hypothetical protein
MNKKTALLPVLPLLFMISACDSSDKGGYRPPNFKPEADAGPANKKAWEQRVGSPEPAPSN